MAEQPERRWVNGVLEIIVALEGVTVDSDRADKLEAAEIAFAPLIEAAVEHVAVVRWEDVEDGEPLSTPPECPTCGRERDEPKRYPGASAQGYTCSDPFHQPKQAAAAERRGTPEQLATWQCDKCHGLTQHKDDCPVLLATLLSTSEERAERLREEVEEATELATGWEGTAREAERELADLTELERQARDDYFSMKERAERAEERARKAESLRSAPAVSERDGCVWVVESGDYEQRAVDLVADSPEAAVAAIKQRYSPPYRVRWDEPEYFPTIDQWEITGHFDAVVGYSTLHKCTFAIARFPLQSAAEGEASSTASASTDPGASGER